MIHFPFNLYLCAFVASLLCSAALLPLWKRWCEWQGHVDDPGHRKIHSTPTPLAGGLTVVSAFFVPLLLAALLLRYTDLFPVPGRSSSGRELLEHGLERRGIQLLSILLGAFAMMLLGWWDDRHELSPKVKFLGQIAASVFVVATGIRITVFIPYPIVNWLLTVLWILTVTNAFNFNDNMNGLCTGLGIISSWACAWAAAIHGQYLVAIFGFLLCGALLGFFPFNFPKASAFLGDAGSHLIGFLAAVLSILPNFYSSETPKKVATLSPLLFLSVPLLDLMSVVWIRLKLRKPIYIGDNNHFSHRMVRAGLSRSSAVLLLLLANAASAWFAFFIFYR